MGNEKKILLIGRHGQAPQKPEGGSVDTLIHGEIQRVYSQIGQPLSQIMMHEEIRLNDTFLTRTNKERTGYTGKAVLIGALGITPLTGENPPKTIDDLSDYDFGSLQITQDDRLNLVEPHANLQMYKEQGSNAVLNYWLKHPYEDTCYGQPMQVFTQLQKRVTDGVMDSIGKIVSNQKRFGVVVSHGTVIETAFIKLIESTRTKPIETIEEIGGGLEMGEFATLTSEKHNGIYRPTLELKGQKYQIDLNKI